MSTPCQVEPGLGELCFDFRDQGVLGPDACRQRLLDLADLRRERSRAACAALNFWTASTYFRSVVASCL